MVNKLKLVKNIANTKKSHTFCTSQQSEIDLIMKLKDEGYLITVIKSIEYSVSKYLRNCDLNVTIHSIESDGDNFNVTIFKHGDHDILVIPKSKLTTGKFNYEFSIMYSEIEQVEKEIKENIKRHKSKKEILYIK